MTSDQPLDMAAQTTKTMPQPLRGGSWQVVYNGCTYNRDPRFYTFVHVNERQRDR